MDPAFPTSHREWGRCGGKAGHPRGCLGGVQGTSHGGASSPERGVSDFRAGNRGSGPVARRITAGQPHPRPWFPRAIERARRHNDLSSAQSAFLQACPITPSAAAGGTLPPVRWSVERTAVTLLVVALVLTGAGINSGTALNTEMVHQPAGFGYGAGQLRHCIFHQDHTRFGAISDPRHTKVLRSEISQPAPINIHKAFPGALSNSADGSSFAAQWKRL
jgi:hypothetical protein